MTVRPPLPLRALIIDDDRDLCDTLSAILQEEAVDVLGCEKPNAAIALIEQHGVNVVLYDWAMPDAGGLELVDEIIATDQAVAVILITGHYFIETAIDAIKRGAFDYLEKPLQVTKLRGRIRELIEIRKLKAHAAELDDDLVKTHSYEGIIGRSPLMLYVYSTIRRVAPHFRTVLISGPSGTGKELVANALHRLSRHQRGPFIVTNCAAVAETLADSEFFGYVRGAFTGAHQDKIGVFEAANGGTIFLDEVGELPLPLQAQLLRVLQNQEVVRVGSPAARKINVQAIAATNRDLRTEVQAGRFRHDLFFRLGIIEISLPPLSERREDLPLLSRYLLEQFCRSFQKDITGFSRRVQQVLSRYSWPGNIRELQNVIVHAAMMALMNSSIWRICPHT